jgi:uncharacterized protein
MQKSPKTQRASRKGSDLLTITILWTAMALWLAACVTVNVNFPESAVQQATDSYVRDLYEAKERGKPSPTPEPSTSSDTRSGQGVSIRVVDLCLNTLAFEKTAQADAANGRLDTIDAKTEEIKQRLKSRVDQVITQKKAGVLGESDDGLLVLKNPEKLSPLLKKKVEKLIEDDNQDRKDLYTEIMKINGMASERRDALIKSFARSFQSASPAGTWIQSDTGVWTQK